MNILFYLNLYAMVKSLFRKAYMHTKNLGGKAYIM